MRIELFAGRYEFLSNFYPARVTYEGQTFPTVEHAFQAAKTLDFAEREKIIAQVTPGQAKRAGKKLNLRPDWDSKRLEVMLELLQRKFETPFLRTELLNTHPNELVEGNTWGDTFWGSCGGKGENNLGKLLMKVRDQIRAEKETGDGKTGSIPALETHTE